MVKGKYARGSNDLEVVVAKGTDSCLWKAIVRLWPNFEKHMFQVIGNGLDTNAWNDCWVRPGHALNKGPNSIPVEVANWRVADLISPSGSWDLDKLRSWLPDLTVR